MNMPAVLSNFFPLKGGLNLVTAPLSIPDGMAIDAVNFDVDTDGGYRFSDGYERYDGQFAPSEALTSPLACELIAATPYGATVVGSISGATARVVERLTTGLIVTQITGNFETGDGLSIGATAVAVNVNLEASVGTLTSEDNARHKALAADIYREDIEEVPGSGPVLGVWVYNDTVYAFRNNSTNAKALMYQATPTGWQAVTFDYVVEFSNANASVGEFDVLTQGGVTATILRVVVESGSLASGTNTGKLIITAPAGGAFAAGAATTTGSGTLTLSGASAEITLPPYGKYAFVNHNFFGSAGDLRMYGVNGVGPAFEFDGNTLTPIKTGTLFDRPSALAVHTGRLVLAIDSSLMLSVAGEPTSFDAVRFAAEIAVGEDVTALQPMLSSNSTATLGVFSRNRAAILYGSDVDTYDLATFTYDTGAYADSVLTLSQVYFMDELGVRQVSPSLNFGNFQSAQLTNLVRPWIRERAGRLSCSAVCRSRSQLRLYFNEGSALHITVDNDRVVGIMPMKTSHTFNVVSAHEVGDGDEMILAGGTDGFVYRLNQGTSFDGLPITGYMNLNFNHAGSPRGLKRYRKAVYEVRGTGYATFTAGYEIGYGSSEYPQGLDADLSMVFGSVYWDNFVWDTFFWDGRSLLPLEQTLDGTAENISLVIKCSSTYVSPFTVSSVILHHTPRRQLR